jgi:hypothetical protein
MCVFVDAWVIYCSTNDGTFINTASRLYLVVLDFRFRKVVRVLRYSNDCAAGDSVLNIAR